METLLGRYAPKFPFNYELHRNELNVALMNGSRVRVGEGRFITFVFFFEDKKGDSIENNKIKGYKSTLTTPHPGPIH